MAPYSSTLAWKIPWMEEAGRLQSMGSWRVGHDWATSLSLFTFTHWRRKWQPTPVFLPGESQGLGSLLGCRLRGRTESDTTEVTSLHFVRYPQVTPHFLRSLLQRHLLSEVFFFTLYMPTLTWYSVVPNYSIIHSNYNHFICIGMLILFFFSCSLNINSMWAGALSMLRRVVSSEPNIVPGTQ